MGFNLNIFNSNSNKKLSSNFDSFINKSPSWDTIDSLVRENENTREREIYDNELLGRGPANHRTNIRLFDAPDNTKPEIILFRDTAAWCPYCFKVWLYLEEKRIPYEIKKSPLRCYGKKTAEHLNVNPSGMLPVAIIQGQVISESNLIIETIEKNFTSKDKGYKPMLPSIDSTGGQRSRVNALLQLERRAFGSWFSWLTAYDRHESRKIEMESILKQIDNELSNGSPGPYFLGNDISIVDIMFTPFLERMVASLPFYKGFTVRDERFPALLKWFEAMDSRKDTYAAIKSDYYTHNMDLPPQIGRCNSVPDAEGYAYEINNFIPIEERNYIIEPMLPINTQEAQRDAARRAICNNEKLIKFACRGSRIKRDGRGIRAVSAPLADPNAESDEWLLPAVDAALRNVLFLMLTNSNLNTNSNTNSNANVEVIQKLPLCEETEEVKECLLYLRDRIGVPRDMSVHAAQQLRQSIYQYIAN